MSLENAVLLRHDLPTPPVIGGGDRGWELGAAQAARCVIAPPTTQQTVALGEIAKEVTVMVIVRSSELARGQQLAPGDRLLVQLDGREPRLLSIRKSTEWVKGTISAWELACGEGTR